MKYTSWSVSHPAYQSEIHSVLAWKSHISVRPAPPFSPAHSNYVQTTSPMIPGVVRQEERVLAGAHTDPS